MALHTNLTLYTPGTTPTGVTTRTWEGEFPDTVTHNGIISWPTAANAVYRGIMFVRGGFDGDDFTLNDGIWDDLENVVNWNSAAQGDASTGYVISAPGIRGINASNPPTFGWTGGLGITGTDEMGGADVDDLAFCWGQLMEWGLSGGQHMVHPTKMGILSYSAGSIRVCRGLREGRFRPAAVAMRSCMSNIYDWDNVSVANKAHVAAQVPGMEGAALKAFTDLTDAEKDVLWNRSPVHWADELPDVPYMLVSAEVDTTALPQWNRDFADALQAAGRTVYHIEVPTATHDFSGTDPKNIAFAVIRKFFGHHLA